MDRGVWWATVHGVAKSQTGLKRPNMHASTPHNLYSIIIGLLYFHSCFHDFQFISIFSCLQFYILFRYKYIYMHKIVLKTPMPASQYAKDNNAAMMRLKPGPCLFCPGQKN